MELSREELVSWRQRLLDSVGLTYEQLHYFALDWDLRPDERDVYETIRSIDYLLDDGGG
jgi:hypothetical protein